MNQKLSVFRTNTKAILAAECWFGPACCGSLCATSIFSQTLEHHVRGCCGGCAAEHVRQSVPAFKFLIDSGRKPAKMFLKFKKVFRNECVSKPRIFEQARWFKKGRSVYDDKRSDALITVTMNANVNCLRVLLTAGCRLTTVMFLVELALTVRPSVSCFTTSYICENCAQNSFRMHRHIHLSRYTNIWWKKYFHIATPTLQPQPPP